MEKLLFRKVELWLVLLLGIFFCGLSVIFGAAALDAERGNKRFGAASQIALTVADVPDTLNRWRKQKDAMAIMKPDRFKDRRGGWTFAGGASALTGYVLLSRYDGLAARHVVELVSLKDGQVRFTWRPDADTLMADAPRDSRVSEFSKMNTRQYRIIHPLLLEDGNLIIKDHETYLTRIDACGGKVWRQDAILVHHSTEPDAGGGFWVPGLIEPQTLKNVTAKFREDALVHVDGDGNILSVTSVPQIFIDHGMDWALFNASNRNSDPLHLNDIEPVLKDGPYWKAGDLFLSIRHISMIMLYRPSTKEIVWMKQGPWLAQHDVDILDDHRIGIFDNHASDGGSGPVVVGANRVTVYDFASQQMTGPWDAGLLEQEVHTLSEGLFSLMPGNGVMVEEENSGRLLFLDANGKLVADYINQGAGGVGYRLGWSRLVDQDMGDKVLAAVAGKNCDAP